MKNTLAIPISFAAVTLFACSTTNITTPPAASTTGMTETIISTGPNPAPTLAKGDKTLELVRIMDGGACKDHFQGVKGTFLIYADPNDVERIKKEKGNQIFTEFENSIQGFSTQALQNAVNGANLAENPFALGADEAQEKLSKQLARYFRDHIVSAINRFQQETGLTIDIIPFAPSLIFYQQHCDAASLEPEN